MKKSWSLGRIFGIDVKLHPTFVLLLIWVGFTTLFSGGDFNAVVLEIFVVLALFSFVVLHELGHALMARRFGIPTRDITLLPIGGVARLESLPEEPKKEFLVAIAGPLVNLVLGTLLLGILALTNGLSGLASIEALGNNIWAQLMIANFTLFAFNLLPAFPMDGGRILRALLSSRIEPIKATQIAANIGRGFALLMGIAGIFFNPFLILTAIFIWFGAGAEAETMVVKKYVKDLVVRDAMVSQFYQVEANQPLESVLELSLQTGQKNIPVISNGHFLGIVQYRNLMKAFEKLGRRAPAYTALGEKEEGISADLSLIDLLPKLSKSKVIPVVEGDQLVGLISPSSVQERIWMQKKMHNSDIGPSQENPDLV
jgi:Zn-dependent protease